MTSPGFDPDSNWNHKLTADHMEGPIKKYLEYHDDVPDDIDKAFSNWSKVPPTPLVAALDPAIAGREGAYILDLEPAPEAKMPSYAFNGNVAEKLCALDEQLVGQKCPWYA